MKKNFKKGFTVLETLIALAVIGLGIGGATLAIRGGLSASTLAKEQVRAFYLAQEAIELIKNKRDANFLNVLTGGTANWTDGITTVCGFDTACTIDAYTGTIALCGGSCTALRQNPATSGVGAYVYGYNGAWTATKYTREIRFESINANEVAVVIRVSWTHGTQTRNFITKTIITNWL